MYRDEFCALSRLSSCNLLANSPVSMLSRIGLINDMHAKIMLKVVAISVVKAVLKSSNVGSVESFDANMYTRRRTVTGMTLKEAILVPHPKQLCRRY